MKEEQEQMQREREEFERREREEQEKRREQMHRPVPQVRRTKQFTTDFAPPRSNSPKRSSTINHEQRSMESLPPFQTSASFDTNQSYLPRKLDSTWASHGSSKSEMHRLTREDMLAMNRKPTPLQRKPDNPDSPTQTDGHVSREAPSKEELHSLNAVPKPRFRKAEDWIAPNQNFEVERAAPKLRSDVFQRDYSTPQDHWLVREAEHRRVAEHNQPELRHIKAQNRHSVNFPINSGPIRPTASDVSNKWLDDSSAPAQRLSYSTTQPESKLSSPRSLPKSLQPRQLPTDYKEFSAKQHHSDVSLTQTLPAGFQFGNSPVKKELSPTQNKPLRHSATETSDNQSVSISGKQKCSHCSEELGIIFFAIIYFFRF